MYVEMLDKMEVQPQNHGWIETHFRCPLATKYVGQPVVDLYHVAVRCLLEEMGRRATYMLERQGKHKLVQNVQN